MSLQKYEIEKSAKCDCNYCKEYRKRPPVKKGYTRIWNGQKWTYQIKSEATK